MTHDPLCPVIPADKNFSDWGCQCDLIAKVRADQIERARTAKATVHVCADNNCWCPKSLSRSELS